MSDLGAQDLELCPHCGSEVNALLNECPFCKKPISHGRTPPATTPVKDDEGSLFKDHPARAFYKCNKCQATKTVPVTEIGQLIMCDECGEIIESARP